MKRIGALVCMMMLAVSLLAPLSFAANDSKNADTQKADTKAASLEMKYSSPANGDEGVAVDNLSFKIRFNKDVLPASDRAKQYNAKQFKLVSEDGVKIPVKVYYSSDEEGLILVAADVFDAGKDKQIKGAKEYTLTIKKDFRATDGSTMAAREIIEIKTLNQQQSTAIYMILMALMMGGMIFFTIRSTKKAEEKEKEEKIAKTAVNPYKEAKRTGKSVEEVVAKSQKKKQKAEEAAAKAREAEKALEAQIMEEIRRENNKRVARPRPISVLGIKYSNPHVAAKKEAEAQKKSNKGTTNPKNQNGKKRNKKAKK